MQTDGIDDLLEQFPDVTCEMDAGYRGLHRDDPGQVSIPPKKPAKDTAPEVIQAREQARHGPVGGRIVTETLIGLLRADPRSHLSVYPRFQPLLGTDLTPGPSITGNRTYSRAHFLRYAGVANPGTYRWSATRAARLATTQRAGAQDEAGLLRPQAR